uniref:Carbohydrate kinase FGGY C-terminal domain-containing protein n=2 Tax=Oryza nivara TaxID=4536 RepID=A0A0E0G2F7_ORYNI
MPPGGGGAVFLGVDGKLLGSASSPIQIWKEKDCIEQSSTDIWHAVCAAVKHACSLANVAPENVVGLGFAATCSLVAVDADGSPVSVSWTGDARRNIIVWMDHRAVDQAERINARNSPVLQYCGGGVSPEMQAPKLLWVKENLQESWSMVCRWMDLSDWLAYRATGDDTRSLCTTVCKWTYLGHAHMEQWKESDSRDMEACGWDEVFWEEIGLGDLELGLRPGIPVGTSLIDAHAGGVGVMESVPDAESKADTSDESDEQAICHRMVLVCGTSTCHMAVSKNKLFIPGVWGPFWSAMVPEFWLTEGGQSATGALLDYIVENHVAAPLLANHAASQRISIYELLNKILFSMAHEQNISFISSLTQDIHVLPDFHGNRSPLADPKSKGIICGFTLDTSEKHLALLYLATIQGIAYGCPTILPRENESVLLGAAVLGAVAAKKFPGVRDAMKALNAAGKVVYPSSDPRVKKYHDAKYQIFRSLYEQQLSHRSAMAQALQSPLTSCPFPLPRYKGNLSNYQQERLVESLEMVDNQQEVQTGSHHKTRHSCPPETYSITRHIFVFVAITCTGRKGII